MKSQYPMTIKPKKIPTFKTALYKAVKCPECGRKTLINGICKRCGYVGRTTRDFVI
jgi:ribosomal protein L32